MDENDVADIRHSVALAPSWNAAMNGLLALMESGNPDGKKWAISELREMAAIADQWVASKRMEARLSIKS